MTIREMMEKRAALLTQARGILDSAESEKRELSAEEHTQYDTIFKDAQTVGGNIKRERDLQEEERKLAENSREKEIEKPTDEKRLKAFRSWLMTGNSNEYRELVNDTDASGGYLHSPEQFMARLLKGLDNSVFVRSHATIIPVTSSDTLGVPTLDTDISDPTWTTEVAEIDEDTDMAFGHRALKPEQLSKMIKVSMKLFKTSALPVENIIADRLAFKFSATQENAFLNGSGTAQPLGIFTASADGIPTARDVATGNTATALTADGLINAKYSLKAQYRGSARWTFHRDAMKAISKLKDTEGQYIWRLAFTANDPDMILGLPVDESEYVPNTFTSGLYVGALCNWSNYWIAELQGVEMQRLNELYARNSKIGFLGRMYADGAPVLAESFARVTLG